MHTHIYIYIQVCIDTDYWLGECSLVITFRRADDVVRRERRPDGAGARCRVVVVARPTREPLKPLLVSQAAVGGRES